MSLFASIISFVKGFIQPRRSESEIVFVQHQNPKVTIVLPVYNQVEYIEQSIDSVLNQTYKNIELIIVNDGSTDGTEHKLTQYGHIDNVIIYSQENKKLPAALNAGFALAIGDYYTWTSADNIMLPNQIQVLLDYLESNLDKGFVYSNYQLIDEKGEPLRESVRGYQAEEDLSLVILPDTVTEENFHNSGHNFIGASFLYRREAAVIVGEYAEDLYAGEDYDYFLRLHTLFKFGHVADILYLYRVHTNTITAKYRDCINSGSTDPIGLKLIENIKKVTIRDIERRKYLRRKTHVFESIDEYEKTTSVEDITVIKYYIEDVINNRIISTDNINMLNVLMINDVYCLDEIQLNNIDVIVSKEKIPIPISNTNAVIVGDVNLTPDIFKYWLFYKNIDRYI